jgi:hypothetical protein
MKPMRLPPRLAFWALAGGALLISHDATWLAQIGPGEALTAALRHGGHDYWGAASAALTLTGLVAATWAGMRLYRLRRGTSVSFGGEPVGRPYLRRAAGAWVRLFGVVAIGFVIQENLEHAMAHGHGLWAGALLGPEYPLALPVIGAITALAALVAAAFVTAERLLLARLEDARPTLRPPRRVPRPTRRIVLPGEGEARRHTGRGPPALLVPV